MPTVVELLYLCHSRGILEWETGHVLLPVHPSCQEERGKNEKISQVLGGGTKRDLGQHVLKHRCKCFPCTDAE